MLYSADKKSRGEFAAKVASCMKYYAEYFNIDYPIDKLDMMYSDF